MMRATPLLVLAALPALLVACSGDPQASGEGVEASEAGAPKRQVVLVLLDAARPDYFSSYGFEQETTPEIDRLASRGVLFRRHYAQGTGTRVSVPSLLASRYLAPPLFPNDPRVPYASPDELFQRADSAQISMPRAFEAAGFATAAISAHLWIGEQTPFGSEFQEMKDLTVGYSDAQYPYPKAKAVVDAALAWVAEHPDEDFFLYLHLMDPHFPHYFEEDAQALFGAASYDARRFNPAGGPQVEHEALTEEDLRYAEALYAGSLRSADRELGRLFRVLDEAPHRPVVAITSDHGEYLRDGKTRRPRPGRPLFSHGGPWHDAVARIPLILYAPGALDPGESDALTEGVDVFPTLLSLAGVELTPGSSLDGVDLTAVLRGELPERDAVISRAGIRTRRHLLTLGSSPRQVLEAPPGGALAASLFDLENDPLELADVAAAQQGEVAGLLAAYRDRLAGPFERAQAARSSEPPSFAFAISSRFVTGEGLQRLAPGAAVGEGWSLLPGTPHAQLVARGNAGPIEVSFPMPSGAYQLSLGMIGRVRLTVGDQRRSVVAENNMAGFGEVLVEGETFRATLETGPQEDLRVFFFGFVPAAAARNAAEEAERLEKLKSLGYVN